MDIEYIVDLLMRRGFLIKRHRDGRIEAELSDEKILIDPVMNAWMYMRGEGKSVYARAFFSLEDVREKLDEVRSSTL
ncbi:MAG TPA: hypothetical protein ENF57_02725 [Candidatus Korarchaeota archaeon]|nr:hypothetical protein [Candidatus Korarchaeota archaeon]